MELRNQDFEIKKCSVQIQKLMPDDDSDDSYDLPAPRYLSPSKPKLKKSTAELLLEHQNLQQNIKRDIMAEYNMEQKFKSLEIFYEDSKEEETQIEEEAVMFERKEDIFCIQESLQFFNSRDVTPQKCGYEFSIGISHFETKMLSFKRVELETVISSFLLTATSNDISDCKSFITYLLRNMSVQEDTASIFACFNTLNSLLTENSDAKVISFSSAEIFMLFFNYGIDINTFKFLQHWPDIQQNFTAPEFNTRTLSKIPSMWTFNLEMILKSFSKLASTCYILDKDLTQIIIYLLWMNLSNLLHMFPLIQENICICLKHITKEKWEESLCDIANIVICMEFPNKKGKWHNILQITEGVPVYLERGIQLRRHISSLVLKFMFSENSDSEMDKNYIEFDISVVQNILQELPILATETLSFAIKFIDIYLTHLNTTKEVYQELCNILKKSESVLHHEASGVKTDILKLFTKVKTFIGKDSVYKVSVLENVFKRIKKEVEEICSENEVPTLENAVKKIKKEVEAVEEVCAENEVVQTHIPTAIKMEVEDDVCSEYSVLMTSKPVDSCISSGEQNVVQSHIPTAIKMEVEEDACSKYSVLMTSKPLDSDINSGEQNIYSTDELSEDFQAATIFCTEDTYFKSADFNVNNVIEHDSESIVSNFEVPEKEKEVVSKGYFMDSSLMVEENANCNVHSLKVDSVSSDDNVSYNLPKPDISGSEHSTVQELSKEAYESQCNDIVTEKVVLLNNFPATASSIESETKLKNLGVDGIEIFEVYSNAISSFQDSVLQEKNVQSMPSPNTQFLKSSDFNSANDYDLTSDVNVFPSVNESINSECEAILNDVVYIDVAEEVCIDSNSNHILNNKTTSIEEQSISLLESGQSLINARCIFFPRNSDEKTEIDESKTYIEMQIQQMKDSLLNSTKCVDEIEHSYANTDEFTKSDPTCTDLITAVKTDIVDRDTESLKRKLQTSFSYEPLSKKYKIENKLVNDFSSKFDNKVIIDPEISNVLEGVVDETVNSPNKFQPNSEVFTNNKEYSNSSSNIIGDCDLDIVDEKEMKIDEDLKVIHIKSSKRKLKNPNALMGSNAYCKNKGLKRPRKNDEDKRYIFYHKKDYTSQINERKSSKLSERDIPGYTGRGLKHKTVRKKIVPKKHGKPFFTTYMQTKQKINNYRKGKSAISTNGLDFIITNYSEPNAEGICCLSDDSDSSSDIIELYTDPKRYADKDCLIVFESEDQIVISD